MVTWFSERCRTSTKFSNDELKKQYGLADTILRNKDQLYVCMKLIEAEGMKSIDHITLQVNNIKESVAWYVVNYDCMILHCDDT